VECVCSQHLGAVLVICLLLFYKDKARFVRALEKKKTNRTWDLKLNGAAPIAHHGADWTGPHVIYLFPRA
jgi:hypothetical protein